jgi:hypothetical protein
MEPKRPSAREAMLCDPKASDASNRRGDAGARGNTNIDGWNLPPAYGTCGDVAN